MTTEDAESTEEPDVLEDLTEAAPNIGADHDTLKYHLLGPSLTKAGQDTVDQQKVHQAFPTLCILLSS